MNVLVINAGSSSLKYQLFDTATNEVRAKGNCERIGIDGRIVQIGSGYYYFLILPMEKLSHKEVMTLLKGPTGCLWLVLGICTRNVRLQSLCFNSQSWLQSTDLFSNLL